MDRPTVTEQVHWTKYPFGHPNRIALTYERPMTDRELAEKELDDYLTGVNQSEQTDQ